MEQETDKLMTAAEVINYLRISFSLFQRLRKQSPNPLPIQKIGGRTLRVKFSELQIWLDRQTKIYELRGGEK